MTFGAVTAHVLAQQSPIGTEIAVPRHLADGEEFRTPMRELIAYGARLFSAVWTAQEGAGRPLTKGTGAPLSDPSSPLTFPRSFNRISGPDANSCAGCHNSPFGVAGGGGDKVSNVFVLGHRFDFATFDGNDAMPLRGTIAENGLPATLQTIADERSTIGMFGSGFIEMLARQITIDLQATRDSLPPGRRTALTSKGISFGTLGHNLDGTWDTSGVVGLAPASVATSGTTPPNLLIRPFQQTASVVSLRQFTNNAYNHHHGIQSEERFGAGTDPDGDGFVNELTRADVTAVTVFQATMAVPGRMISRDPAVEAAVRAGEQTFSTLGCATCHVPLLPLDRNGWVYTEPSPFNPAGNLRVGEAPTLSVDLTSDDLPQPRLKPVNGIVWVPAFTDLKLHDISAGPNDENREPLNQNAPAGSPALFDGNARFLTRKLWGSANEPPYCHHGMFTTLREAVLAHAGEAAASRAAFGALSANQQDAVIEFLKSLRVLAPGSPSLVVDERGRARDWDTASSSSSHGRGSGRR